MITLKNLLIKEEEPVIRKKKFHIGGGVYVDNEKDKDNPKAQRFKKDDSGKYIPIDDSGKKKPKNVPNIFDKPEVGTKVKDGKLKSSGPQQFADDVKNMKGEFDLDGGMKIKDGKMYDADGNQMDSDDIEDFYYQDAFDEKGINVGIDVKEKPKSVQKNTIIKNKMIQKTVLNDLAQEYDEAKENGDKEKMSKISRKHNLHKMHFEAQSLAIDVIETQGDFNIDKVKEVVAGDPEKTSSEDLNAAVSEINDLIDDIKSDDDYDRSEVKQLSKLRRRLKGVNLAAKFNASEKQNENCNPNDKYLTESMDLLKRDFGQPLPTLQSVMEKHQKNVKESPDDVKITKKQLQMLIKQEAAFRKRMLNIEQGFLRDPRPENKKLAKDIKKSYKDNVTKFMREVVGMLKRMK